MARSQPSGAAVHEDEDARVARAPTLRRTCFYQTDDVFLLPFPAYLLGEYAR